MIRNKLNVPGCCEEVDAGLPRVVALERQDISALLQSTRTS